MVTRIHRRIFLRKFVHVLLGTFLLSLIILVHTFYGSIPVISFLGLLTILYGAIDYYRMSKKGHILVIEPLYAPYEKKKFSGAFFSLVASLICISVFPFQIALAAIAINVYADPLSFFLKKLCGMKGRNFAGSLPYIWVGLFVAFMLTRNLPLAMVMSIAATVADYFSTKIDDNLSTPLAAAIAGFVFMLLVSLSF